MAVDGGMAGVDVDVDVDVDGGMAGVAGRVWTCQKPILSTRTMYFLRTPKIIVCGLS